MVNTMIFLKRLKRSLENMHLMLSGDYGGILTKAGPLLPIGVYLVDQDGNFKYCNKYCRKILGIPEDADVSQRSIRDYYVHPEQRTEIIEKMTQNQGLSLNQIIKFKKENSNAIIYVEDNCKQHANGLSPNKYCFVGGITDVTDIVRYQKLFDGLSAGVFRINKYNCLVMVNKAVAKIFGYNSASEMLGLDVRKMWKSENDFNEYITLLLKNGELNNYKAEMVKKDGQSIHISINSKLWKSDDDNLIGREGTFTDITNEIKFSGALERFSNGFYEVKQQNDKHIITNCNEMFAKMHGYNRINDVIGLDITDFYFDQKSKDIFLQKLEKAEKENRSEIKKVLIQAKKKDRTPFWIQVDCGLKRDTSGKVVGREGVVVDVNERVLLEKQLEEKQAKLKETMEDMDKFVHQYIAPLMNIDSTAQTLLEILEKRLSKKIDDIRQIEISVQPTNNLILQIDEFLEAVKSENESEKLIYRLEKKKLQLVQREEKYKDPILRELWTREVILDILEIIVKLTEKYQSQKSSNIYSILKKIKKIILDIYDIYILQLHKKILDNTQITYKVIESLRRYSLSSREIPFDFSKSNIMNVIKNNIELYYDLAKKKGLTIIPPDQSYILVEISENHIDRMISNLLLNAIKYSHQRPGGFIKVNVNEKRHEVEIRIENYGVPVMQEELEKVFEYGYRGKFSYDWNRTGSGIGLADAKITVEKHGGQIHLSSIPAPSYAQQGDYNVPYLTRVAVTLPKRRKVN